VSATRACQHVVTREDLPAWTEKLPKHDQEVLAPHANAVWCPKALAKFGRLVVVDGRTSARAAEQLHAAWTTAKRRALRYA